MRCSIKWVLISGVIGLLIVSVSIILASSYVTSQQVLRQHAQSIMQTIAAFTISEAQHYLTPAQDIATLTQLLAHHDIIRQDNIPELEQYFYDQLSQRANIAGMYLGFPTGAFIYVSRSNKEVPGGFFTKIISVKEDLKQTRFIWKDANQQELLRETVPNDDFETTTRPWYVRAVERGQMIWTDPYVFYTSRTLGVTAAIPLRDTAGALVGVVGVDIEIDSISTFLSELKIGQHGRAFIVDRAGSIVAFPDHSMLTSASGDGDGRFRPATINELDDVLSRKTFATMEQLPTPLKFDGPWFADFTHQKKTYHVMLAPFTSPQWPWILGLYLPEDDYLGAIKRNRALNISIMLGIAALGSVIGWVIVRSIVKPMTALQLEARRIRHDDLDQNLLTPSIIKEIQDTIDAFAQMKAELNAFRERTLQFEQDLIRLSEQEQRRLGQELHDGLGQLLMGTSLVSQMLADDLAAHQRPEASEAAQVAQWVHEALNAAHDAAHGLYPEALASQGLGPALQSLGAQAERLFGITCKVSANAPDDALSPHAALHLYRIAQEALTNAIKHGEATEVKLQVEASPTHLWLMVCDNGVGLPECVDPERGMGLRNMRTRAAMLEASLTIERGPKGGTEVTCNMPLDARIQA